MLNSTKRLREGFRVSLSDVETGSPTTLSCLPQVLTTGLLIPMQATPCSVTQAQKCLLSTSLPSCLCMEVFAEHLPAHLLTWQCLPSTYY